MTLNVAELSGRLFSPTSSAERLVVLPLPDKVAFENKAGASIDLHLGRWFTSMKQTNISEIDISGEKPIKKTTREYFVRFNEKFLLHPGKFVLGISLEWLAFPGNLVGFVTGKSSLGRFGLVIETAAGIHPGYAGCLTLELTNVGEIPIALRPGMEICQIFIHRATSINGGAASQFKGSRKPGIIDFLN
jgi:dCTP deaminase